MAYDGARVDYHVVADQRPGANRAVRIDDNAFADAARLFEAGGDLRSALRAALAGKDNDTARRLMATVPAEQLAQVLEKAGSYELLISTPTFEIGDPIGPME